MRFAGVGVTATGVHYAVYWLLQHVLNVNVAYTAGYLSGFVLNFYLTARFTFRTRPSWTKLFGMGAAPAVHSRLPPALPNPSLVARLTHQWAPIPAVALPSQLTFCR